MIERPITDTNYKSDSRERKKGTFLYIRSDLREVKEPKLEMSEAEPERPFPARSSSKSSSLELRQQISDQVDVFERESLRFSRLER